MSQTILIQVESYTHSSPGVGNVPGHRVGETQVMSGITGIFPLILSALQ